MPLFHRTPRLDAASSAGLTTAYAEATGRKRPNQLAVAKVAGQRWLVLLDDCLMLGAGEKWQVRPWHTIESGTWHAESQMMGWVLIGGVPSQVELADPGVVPTVFRERLQASILMEEIVEIPGTHAGGVVSARRDLGDPTAPLQWHGRPNRGTPNTPAVRAALDAHVKRLRADFE